MPPKRKATTSSAPKSLSKKAKLTTIADKLRKEDSRKPDAGTGKIKVDSQAPGAPNAEVYESYGCMLNQTNIGANNNKFYVIQLLKISNKFAVFTRWGRVGETGATATSAYFSKADDAVKEFEKKFKSKTNNHWKNRDKFEPAKGKYTLLEMDDDDEDDEDQVDKAPAGSSKASKLDSQLQEFVRLIFDRDMFNDTLTRYDLDTKKMPLGKISKSQIAKGFDVLSELEKVLKKSSVNSAQLSELSSKFYTVIPHSFGRSVPPIIRTQQMVNDKKEMLLVLGDIVTAQEMEKAQAEAAGDEHELDKKYETLNASLNTVPASAEDFKLIEKYLNNTKGGRHTTIRRLFKVKRDAEEDRYKKFSSYKNKKMLWHGTSVAVAAAILKGGLRIMPHSGGRVGKGIYFASEADKSLGYTHFSNLTRGSKSTVGVFFLNEVALGDMHVMYNDGEINYDGPCAPGGKQSTWAIGHTEPDPKVSKKLKFEEGRSVEIVQGKTIKQPHHMTRSSSFRQSEYVVYNEGQVRIRYVLLLERA